MRIGYAFLALVNLILAATLVTRVALFEQEAPVSPLTTFFFQWGCVVFGIVVGYFGTEAFRKVPA